MIKNHSTPHTGMPENPVHAFFEKFRYPGILMLLAIISIVFFSQGFTTVDASSILGVTLTPTATATPTATDLPPTEPAPTKTPVPVTGGEKPDIYKWVSSMFVKPGETFKYFIDITNNSSKLKYAFVRDPLSASLEYVGATTSKGSIFLSDNNVVIAELGNLEPKETAHIEITVKVLSATAVGSKICNFARIQYTLGDRQINTGSNSACIDVVVAPPPSALLPETTTDDETTPTDQGSIALQPPAAADGNPVHYMVKFVCGLQAEVETGEPPVKPGNYATAINLHNYTGEEIVLTYRPALHYTVGADLPPTFELKTIAIAPFSVLELDCNELWNYMALEPGEFIKGMVDIGSPVLFPVVAVYTALVTDHMEITETGAGISIDVEYIDPFLPYTP